jgi:hypothetical protein
MALTLFQVDREFPIAIRPGDVIFHHGDNPKFPLHVGIYIGTEQSIGRNPPVLRVRGLPGHKDGDYLGDSEWGITGEYQIDLIGQRKDVDPVLIKQVVQLSRVQLFERPQIVPRCEWVKPELVQIDRGRLVGDGFPVFLRGTCAQFVEFIYEIAELELLASRQESSGPWPQKVTFDPDNPLRIYATTHAHIFWTGSYGLRSPWDHRFGLYPACIFGEKNDI